MAEARREQIDSGKEWASAQLSIRKADTEHFERAAKEHSLTSSVFLLLAVEGYFNSHGW